MLTRESNQTGKVLNDLVQVFHDSSMRFHDAVGRLENEELRRIFHELESDRATFAMRLRKHVSRFGENPTDTETVTGKVRRAAREMKTLVLRSDDVQEVAVCAAGEESLRQRVKLALSEVPDDLRAMLAEQHDELKLNCKLLSELQQTME